MIVIGIICGTVMWCLIIFYAAGGIILMLYRIIIAILLAALCGSLGWNWWIGRANERLSEQVTTLNLAVGSCEEKVHNLKERIRRVTNVDDPDFIIPPEWMLPQ